MRQFIVKKAKLQTWYHAEILTPSEGQPMTSDKDLRADLLLLIAQWQKEAENARDHQGDEKPVPAGVWAAYLMGCPMLMSGR